jgi:hypothetical protein
MDEGTYDQYRGTGLWLGGGHLPYPCAPVQEQTFPVSGGVSRTALRRAALVAILGPRAESILERIVADAVRATDFVGLGRAVAQRYSAVSRACLPVCLAALGAAEPERTRLFEENAKVVKDLVAVGVPKFVQRSLVSLGFRVANGVVRDSARSYGFEPDELEDELRVFQRAFEARIFFGAS